jgi:hypothetical protein
MMTRTVVRAVGVAAAVVLSVGALAACGSDEEAVVLDLETLQAQTQAGEVRAQRAEVSFVGSFGEGQAIGVAFSRDLGVVGASPADEIVVYLYDRQELAMMRGQLGAEGAAVLSSHETSDFDATVELTVDSEAASGTLTFDGQDAVSFTAEVATGVAGVYWAQGAADDPDVRCDWLVLGDGRQWGCVCVPPVTGPCCPLRR